MAEALGVSRSNLVRSTSATAPSKPRGGYLKADDEWLLPLVRAVVHQRASYGYRRVTALVNRQRASEGKPGVNHKRVYRVMKAAGLLLARHTGKPTRTHEGTIVTLK
ncbi:IS3 family transposase, partial [Citreicoccus inhibens]|uniref:IS3 family transposase n=1 Tax=Citreicoccus inhibens TaxID=2849499 RepID=UPI002E2DFD57